MGAEPFLVGGFQEGSMTGKGGKVVLGRAPPKGTDVDVKLLVTGVMVGVVVWATGKVELATMATGLVGGVVLSTGDAGWSILRAPLGDVMPGLACSLPVWGWTPNPAAVRVVSLVL